MDKIADGSVYRRCGCRDAVSGRQFNGRVRAARRPGAWSLVLRGAGDDAGRRGRVRRGGFASEVAAERARQAFLALPDAAAARVVIITRAEYDRLEATRRQVGANGTRIRVLSQQLQDMAARLAVVEQTVEASECGHVDSDGSELGRDCLRCRRRQTSSGSAQCGAGAQAVVD